MTTPLPTGETEFCYCGDYERHKTEDPDQISHQPVWRPDGTCSWCGSQSPEYVLARLTARTAYVEHTTKNYKGYLKAINPTTEPVSGPTGKFYTWHFSEENLARLNDVLHLHLVDPVQKEHPHG